MPRAALPALVWALVQAAPGGFAQAPPPSQLALVDVLIEGGSESDRVFARRAMSVQVGKALGAEELETALVAVRATDRFRSVKGVLEPVAGGQRLRIDLDAWPRIQHLVFRGDEPLSFRKVVFPELRRGTNPGEFRIRRWVDQAQQRLHESGYPQAQVRILRDGDGSSLVAEVLAGPPTLIKTCRVDGDLGPYTQEKLLKVSGIQPGRTLWTQDLVREAQQRLRKRFVKDKRLEGQSELKWEGETASLVLRVNAGPRVSIRFEGSWSIWWKNRKDLNPFARAGSYSPELLNEGDQRILHYLRSMGHLDGVVTHRREVVSADEVRITFLIEPGQEVRIDRLRFEGNQAVSSKALRKAANLPKGHLGLAGAPVASSDLIGVLEDRIKALYWNLGYSGLTIRKQFEKQEGGKTALVFQIHEKPRRTLEQLVLEVPGGEDWHPWSLAECLALILCDRPAPEAETPSSRHYKGDRLGTQGVTAVIEESQVPGKPSLRLFTLTPSRALPFIRNDLALVFSALRQRTAALGGPPIPRPKFEEDEHGTSIRFEVPEQPLGKIQGLVVQGSDRTQAKAVFRELELDPDSALSPERLAKAQSNLNGMGVFQRLDMMAMNEEGVEESQNRPWKDGDLLLKATERPPWVVTSAFGYDKSQGYHVGLGVQRLNVGGMGRTVDMGIRAGDGTIQNPTLKKIFPTGDYDRSVDMFSIGYTDPWLTPEWLPERTRLRLEGAYLEEHQDVYLLHRRRVIGELEWRLNPHILLQTGYRFERTNVRSDYLSPEDLKLVARSPQEGSIISAPYIQVNRDTRDSILDPKNGSFSSIRLELAAQVFGTGSNSSFVKVDLRHQWHWGLGQGASNGVVTLGLRVGAARPTASTAQDLPLSERFFAGGPNTHRGVEPDTLGPYNGIILRDPQHPDNIQVDDQGQPKWKAIPLGGQALALVNLEYRFPLIGQSIWGEVFVDSGQVYQYLHPLSREEKAAAAAADETRQVPLKYRMDNAAFPPFQTALGLGLIFKIGIPIKIEYAADVKRILGQPRTQQQRETQLKGLLISAGFQF